jgi:two-component sensor histidine kinase/PAS domain-containing protein
VVVGSPIAAAKDTFSLPDKLNGVSFDGVGYYLIDEKGNLTVREIIEDKLRSFKPTHSLRFGLTNATVWVFIDIINPINERRTIYIENRYATTDYLSIFQKKEGQYFATRIGDRLPFEMREVPFRLPTFKVTLEPGLNRLFFRTQSTGSVLLNLHMWDEEQFADYRNIDDRICTVVFGFLIFIAGYNFLLFLSYRDLSFLWYVLYIFCIVLFFAGFLGYAQQLPVDQSWRRNLQNNSMMIAGHFTQLFVILFTIRFLNLKIHRPLVRNLLLVPIAIPLVGVLASFFDYNLGTKLVVINAIIMAVILLGFGLNSCIGRYRPAYYYIVGWGFLLGGSVVTGLGSMAVVNSEALTNWSQFTGALFETIIFSLALGDKMRYRSEHAIKREQRAKHQLADLNRDLETHVRERTKDLQNLLDNIEQGIFVVSGENCRIEPNYSQHLETILDRNNLAGEDPIEVLFEHATLNRDVCERVQACIFASLGEDIFTYEANESNLITEFDLRNSNGELKKISTEWKPIVNDQSVVEKILIVVKDITILRRLQIKQQEHNEELQKINEILRVPIEKWEGFVEAINGMIAENCSIIETTEEYHRAVIDRLFINLHTAKGLSRSYLLDNLTEIIFKAECFVKSIRDEEHIWDASPLLAKHVAISKALESYDRINCGKLGRVVSHDRVSIDKIRVEKQVARVVSSIDNLPISPVTKDALIALKRTEKFLYNLLYPSLNEVLDDVLKSVTSLAEELDKLPPDIDLNEIHVGIVNEAQDILVMIFNHLIRNSLDHGIEDKNVRQSCGKRAKGRIYINCQMDEQGLVVTYGDDGAGLDIVRIKEIAVGRGIVSESADLETLANTIFLSGFSTASSVTSFSGNGVGMDAVRKYLAQIGGSINLELRAEQLGDDGRLPFVFTIRIPGALVCEL